MHARNMHQYSAAKTKKIDDAARWFERCEIVLTNAIESPSDSGIEDVVSTPRVPLSETGSPFYGPDNSPLVQKKGTSVALVCNFENFRLIPYSTERIERLTRTISRLIDGDPNSPYCDETDPFTSNNPALQRKYLSYIQARLTPPPLRIRKGIPLHVDIPSPSPKSLIFISAETGHWDESMMSTPVQRYGGGLRSLASIMEDMSDCDWTLEAWNNSTMSRGHDVSLQQYPATSASLFPVDDRNGFTSQAIYEARIEAKKEVLRAEINRRVSERMPQIDKPILVNSSSFASLPETRGGPPRSVSDMIRDYLGEEGAENMTPSCLRPIPRSSSAKPMPLCLKPKQTMRVSDSDKASLAHLQRAWELASFGGWYMADSDCHSLSLVEQTWLQLCESYHLDKFASHDDIEARISRFDHLLTSLVYSLHRKIFDLHQLATEINHNRTLHLQTRKIPPSKSYWSFSALSKDVPDENSREDPDNNQHSNRGTSDMRFNSGWAAPGTVLNESKAARIERLRKYGFNTVGLRNGQRGHKGTEWYSYLCEEALKDVTCL